MTKTQWCAIAAALLLFRIHSFVTRTIVIGPTHDLFQPNTVLFSPHYREDDSFRIACRINWRDLWTRPSVLLRNAYKDKPYTRHPIVRWLLDLWRARPVKIGVDGKQQDPAVFLQIVRDLKRGDTYHLFPAGTRAANGGDGLDVLDQQICMIPVLAHSSVVLVWHGVVDGHTVIVTSKSMSPEEVRACIGNDNGARKERWVAALQERFAALCAQATVPRRHSR